ncbi:hypothetical protein ACTFIW_011830 [Dictyostelium discoideum]
MEVIGNISYIISTTLSHDRFPVTSEGFILSIKEDELYCKSLSKNSNNPSKNLINSLPYIKIQEKTFGLSCIYFSAANNNTPIMLIHEIDYCEPDDSFSRYSCKESFCVANVHCDPMVGLVFKTCHGLKFFKKK